MNRVAQIAAGALALVVVGGACFGGGMLYGKSQAQTPQISAQYAADPSQQGAPLGDGQFMRGSGQGGATTGGMRVGQIQEIGNGVMTLQDSNGNQVQVRVTETTLIQKQMSVSLSDLQTGETVLVSGSQGTDGSITARSVQVTTGAVMGTMDLPAGAPGGGRGRNPGGTAP